MLFGSNLGAQRSEPTPGGVEPTRQSPSLSPSDAGYRPPFQRYTALRLGVVFDNPPAARRRLRRTTPVADHRVLKRALFGLPLGKPPSSRRHEIGRVKFRDRNRWQELINFRGHPQNHRPVDHSGPFWEATDDRRTVDGRRAWPAEYEEPVNSGRSADGR